MQVPPEPGDTRSQVAELEERSAALRQAASLPAADLAAITDAVLTELECAIEMLAVLEANAGTDGGGRFADGDGAERRMLRAAFTDVPVPLFLLATDSTVLRVNKSAGQLLGSKPGYATGRPFTAFVALPARATVKTQLTAVARSGTVARIKCGLLSSQGAAVRELTIGLIRVTGEADRLVVAISDDSEAASSRDAAGNGGADSGNAIAKLRGADAAAADRSGPVQALTQRMDLATAVSRLLLESENFSESMTLQRSARLLADELAAWVIVDLDRRGLLVRQLVIGPEGPGLAEVSGLAASVNPTPGSLSQTVHDSGQAVLIAHVDDAAILGPGPGDVPLLMLLGTTSVLSVPITNGGD